MVNLTVEMSKQSSLSQRIRNRNMDVRCSAVAELRKTNTPWALELLQKVANEDRDWEVRWAAELALNKLNQKINN